ncbi:PDZ domain-containing protein [Paenibacillus albicereus]|uniref:PDZ domain-containing protein n=1 Tax=Paenibacillus albicereus TaxID=2726185 RepID=A0A6H2H332_9BACL|nr:trypsin-like peptidase domain-containing protein [Paenibacillus albicereus]QJC54072.1 PDZ domain-containing protein [Paenibacillus albicereus]
MGLFEDEFYSTRISRRASKTSRKQMSGFPLRSRKDWGVGRLALLSGASGAAIVLVLTLTLGGGSPEAAVETAGTQAASGLVAPGDAIQQTVAASSKVRPAVVSVVNEQAAFLPQAEEGAEDGSDAPQDSAGLQPASVGSGVIFAKKDGKAYLITNNHVIEGAAGLKVVLIDGQTRPAQLVGGDYITDLAVLEIDGEGIDSIAEMGDSAKLQSGEMVMAIGNPLGLGDSLSMGIVSKTKQIIPVSLSQDGNYDWEQEVIQTDASINQGNSGGPLIDMQGRVIGINSMKISDIGVEGVGFAIPVNNVMPIVDQLMKTGAVPRPYLGVYTLDLASYYAQQGLGGGVPDAEDGDAAAEAPSSGGPKLPVEVTGGVIVLEAVGPASEAGLEFNDVITKLDDQPIGSTMELRKYLYGKKRIGDKIKVTFYRDGKPDAVTFKLEDKSEEEE